MAFTVIIPARMASTRLPDKPLADIAGKPMVVRVAECAAQSGAAQVIVATDHPDIVAACQRYGFDARIADGAVVASALIDVLAGDLDAAGRAKPGTARKVLDQVAALAAAVRKAKKGA